MSGQGQQIFADQLRQFADEAAQPGVAEIADRVAAPLRVTVRGRRGTGRRTVGQALKFAGTAVTEQPDADVTVYVVAEAVKPEDTAAVAVAAAAQPVLVVLNKVDLVGCAGVADVADVATRIRAPVEPMAGLLAVAALGNRLDDTLWAALRVLAAEPADSSVFDCADRFIAGAHRVPRRVRLRLCETLDLPALTRAVAVVRHGGSAGQVRALLRRLSGIDTVVGRLTAIGAAAHYRRLTDAVVRLEALAAGQNTGLIDDFLTRGDTVAARAAAAAAVLEAAGLTALPADGPTARLQQALHWQRYSRGPVGAAHRACALDVARGLLRQGVTSEVTATQGLSR